MRVKPKKRVSKKKLPNTSTTAKRALAIIRKSRSSHHEWIAYYDKYPHTEKRFTKTVGDVKFHQCVIKGYDFVIDFLQKLSK